MRGANLAYTSVMNANDATEALKDQTKQALEKAGDQLSEQASNLGDLANDFRYRGEDFIQTNPWVAVSLAAGVGLLVGMLIARR